ncbi:MAG: hypothetical protein HOO06_01200 [Bdellovibrionaceae bacterium]|jgi:hypothetical protein|nr:hypothetical protein [Pseudobdellovibrionaceae bacterium]
MKSLGLFVMAVYVLCACSQLTAKTCPTYFAEAGQRQSVMSRLLSTYRNGPGKFVEILMGTDALSVASKMGFRIEERREILRLIDKELNALINKKEKYIFSRALGNHHKDFLTEKYLNVLSEMSRLHQKDFAAGVERRKSGFAENEALYKRMLAEGNLELKSLLSTKFEKYSESAYSAAWQQIQLAAGTRKFLGVEDALAFVISDAGNLVVYGNTSAGHTGGPVKLMSDNSNITSYNVAEIKTFSGDIYNAPRAFKLVFM